METTRPPQHAEYNGTPDLSSKIEAVELTKSYRTLLNELNSYREPSRKGNEDAGRFLRGLMSDLFSA